MASLGALPPLAPLVPSTNVMNTLTSEHAQEQRIQAVRIAVMFSPPTIALEYKDLKHGGKTRVHKLPLGDDVYLGDVDEVIDSILKQRPEHFSCVQAPKLREIVQRLLLEGKYERRTNEQLVDSTVDLNKVSEDELRRNKQVMNISYERNRVETSSADFEYDKRVEFQPTQEHEWDDGNEEGDNDTEEDEIVFSNADDSDDMEF